jgi:hypothetical protein
MAAAPTIVGGGTYIGSGGNMQEATMAGAAAALLKHGVKGINQGVMQRIGEMLASSDPHVYGLAMETIAKNKPLSDTFKSLTPKLVTTILAQDAQSRKTAQQRQAH